MILYDTFIKQPREVQLTDGRKIKHYYDGAGTLLKTIYYTASNTVLETWDFVGNMIYKTVGGGQPLPYQMTTPEGRATYNAGVWTYEFDYKDHLGNTRVSFKANGNQLEKTAEAAFDPWGVRMNIGLVNAFQNRFEFLNRQKESTFGLNSYRLGARGYNGTIGRFDAVDPVTTDQEHYSTYQYSWNNPVLRSDPNGDCPLCKKVLKSISEFSEGAIAAYFDDNNLIAREQFVNNEKGGSYASGVTFGHSMALLQGGFEVVGGAGGEILAVAGAPASGGATLVGTTPSTATIVHGVTVASKAIYNLNAGANSSNTGSRFNTKEKTKVIESNKEKNSGKTVCENCKVETTKPEKSKKGVTPPKTDTQIDHIKPKSKGGQGKAENGQVLCRGCNRQKSDN